MRVLVTGITGQVGSHLIASQAPPGVTWLPADRARLNLSEPEAIRAVLDRLAPDLVVNCAAFTAVDRAEAEPDLADRINHRAPAELARAGVPLIHLSTDYVFDGDGGAPYPPDAPPAPINVYGATKAAGERAVREAGDTALILRTSWVFSARGTNFVRTMLRLGAERDVLHAVADQRGCPTAAVDVAMALRTLVDRGARGGSLPSGTWNLCSPTPATWHELAEAVFTLARPTWRHRPTVHAITTAEWPTPAKRPADTRLDCTATMRDLGISCRPWREALPEVVAALLGDESCSVPPTTPRQEPA